MGLVTTIVANIGTDDSILGGRIRAKFKKFFPNQNSVDKSPETTSSAIIIFIRCQQSRSSADKQDQKISEEINDSIERTTRKTGSKNLSCLLLNLPNNEKYRYQANNQTFIEKRESSSCDTSI